jgi:hypothetical protein
MKLNVKIENWIAWEAYPPLNRQALSENLRNVELESQAWRLTRGKASYAQDNEQDSEAA